MNSKKEPKPYRIDDYTELTARRLREPGFMKCQPWPIQILMIARVIVGVAAALTDDLARSLFFIFGATWFAIQIWGNP